MSASCLERLLCKTPWPSVQLVQPSTRWPHMLKAEGLTRAAVTESIALSRLERRVVESSAKVSYFSGERGEHVHPLPQGEHKTYKRSLFSLQEFRSVGSTVHESPNLAAVRPACAREHVCHSHRKSVSALAFLRFGAHTTATAKCTAFDGDICLLGRECKSVLSWINQAEICKGAWT